MISRDQLIERDVFKRLSQVNNVRAAFDLALRLVLHLGCIVLSYYFFSAGNFLLAILCAVPHFVSFSFLGWAGIGHELFHGTVFSSRKLNTFLFRLFSILTWNNYGYFEVTHWKHHKDTLLPDDPEGNPTVGLRKSEFLWLLTFDFPSLSRRLKVLMLNVFGVVPGPLGATLFSKGTPQRAAMVNAARVIVAFHLLLATLFLLSGAVYLILLVSLATFCVTFLNRLFAVAQHYGTEVVPHPDYLLTTRTVVLDPVSSFLYANMNYHIEHHFFPSIPYYNLPQVHGHLRRKLNYLYYANGIGEMVSDLKRQGCFKG